MCLSNNVKIDEYSSENSVVKALIKVTIYIH